MTTNQYIKNVKNNNWPAFSKRLWQRSFHGHIIRTTDSLQNIREYTINNLKTWHNDEHNIINYSIKGKACLILAGHLV